jgi:hypothetical protein
VSTLINPAWWMLCVALIVCAAAHDPRTALRRALRFAAATPVLATIASGAIANVSARAMLGYAAPGDFVQEVAAARSMRSHTTLYPADVNETVHEWLVHDRPTVPGWMPGAVRRWLQIRQQYGRNRLVAQAHPPTLLLAAAPFVLVLGPYAAYWTLTVASIAAALLTAGVLVQVLAPAASCRVRILAALALLSWQPVLATVRDGQVSMLLGALLVLAWDQRRRGNDARAGVAAGVAAALKLFPLIVLVPLAVRLRAVAVAAAVIAGAGALVVAVLGAGAWTEYAASGRLIAASFATAPHNLSILARLGAVVPAPLIGLVYLTVASAAVVATLVVVQKLKGTVPPARTVDVEFAAFITMAVCLSPVAWHHYVCVLVLPLAVLALDAWASGCRAALASVIAVATVLSVPDDVWRTAWSVLPPRATLLVSPGIAAVLLWAGLLWSAGRNAQAIPSVWADEVPRGAAAG